MDVHQRATPLAKRQLFRSHDLDEARAIVAAKFCAHRLERNTRDDRFDALQNHVAGRAVSLNYLRYGADVTIAPGELSSFYLLQIPISGTAEIANGGAPFLASPSCASMLNPQRPTRMRWAAGCEKLLVQIDRTAMEETAEAMIGRRLPGNLLFESAVDMAVPDARRWFAELRSLFAAADAGGAFAAPRSLRQAAIEREIMEGFLRLQPNSLSHRIAAVDGCRVASARVRAARAIIHDRAREPLTVSSIAGELGVSERALQIAFRAEYGLTPKEALTEERLLHAHDEIQFGDPAASLAEIADSCGFAHHGRFAAAYRARFGRTPRSAKSDADRRRGVH